MITTMLDLSTSNAPSNCPSFGSFRFVTHEYGWTVFVDADRTDDCDCPDWFRPILMEAVKHKCVLINFDRDADEDSGFKTYDW